MHEVLVNRLGGLSLPRKSVVRLTDRPDMTLDVYRGRKTTIQLASDANFIRAVPVTCWAPFLSSPLAGKRDIVVTIFVGLNTILFQKYFKYTCIIDIQQIDQDLIVSSWLIYIISWNVHNLQQNRWFKHMGHMTWKYSMVSNGKSRNFDIEDKQINK